MSSSQASTADRWSRPPGCWRWPSRPMAPPPPGCLWSPRWISPTSLPITPGAWRACERFAQIDLHPETVSTAEMGLVRHARSPMPRKPVSWFARRETHENHP